MAKVLIATRWYPSEESPANGLFVKEFVKATALHNNVVVLFGELTSSGHSRFPYEISDRVEDGIRTVRFIYKRRFMKLHRLINFIASTHCLMNIMREDERVDIIHLHVYLASLPAVIFAKLYRIPLVITEHYTGFVRQILTVSERILARIIMRSATIILPVSNYLKKYIQPYAPQARFEVVSNIVDSSMFKSTNAVIKDKDEQKLILTVGRLDPAKGTSYLLEALSLLKTIRKDFFLNIIGDGSIRKELEQKAKSLELDDFVQFHGIKLKSQVAGFMSKCDFFVLPSLFETFGCVIIEAMACGKPVVATNIGGPDEIVTQQTGILVKSANAESLKNGLEYMLDNYHKYSATDISRYAGEAFSLEHIGQKLNQIYNDILAKRLYKR
jgi:glycosyltransferase involved in cell wall biosynthesis